MTQQSIIDQVRQELATNSPEAAVKVLDDLGTVTEQKKNRSYSYKQYVKLLSG